MAVILSWMVGFLPIHLQAQQRYLEDNFNYNVGDLTDQGGWLSNRTSTNDLEVQELAMTWDGYATTAKAVHLPAASADKLSKQFNMDLITSGSVYYSFLLRVQSLDGTNSFIGLGQVGENNMQVYGQVAVKKNADDETKYHIGVARKSGVASSDWSEEAYAMANDLLVVVKYTFVGAEAKDDEVVLYAAPVSLEQEPQTPTSRHTGTSQMDCPGMNAVMLYPAGTSMNKNAEVSLSALRVASTWEGLFAATPDAPTPVFSVQYENQGGVLPIQVLQYTQTKARFKVKAENLTGDVTLVPPAQNGITLDKTTLPKAQLESAEGVALTVTLDADLVNVNDQTAVIGFQTEGLDQPYEYTLQWMVATVDKRNSIAALKEITIDQTAYYALDNLVVTYVDASAQGGELKYYAQDANGGILIEDAGLGYSGRVYEAGDRLPLVIGTVTPAGMIAPLSMTLLTDPGEAAAKQQVVTPVTLTLAELQEDKARYACVLVKIENAEFFNRASEATSEGKFVASAKNYKIRQTEAQTTFNARTLNTTFGTTKVPLKAHLTGISTSVSGTVIGLRSPADITVVDEGNPVDPGPEQPDDPQPGDAVNAGDNLFENAGFEAWDSPDDFNDEGKPTGWDINMGTAYPNALDIYKIEGAKSLKVQTPGKLTNTLRQLVSVQFIAGKSYRIRLPYYIAEGAEDGNNLQLISYWQGPASVGEINQDEAILNSGRYLTTKTGQWDTLEFVTTAPEQATGFYFALRINKGTTVYFDNFSFYRLEKPSDIKPRIFVDTKFLGTVSAFLNQTDSASSVSVSGELLTAPVTVSISGRDAAYFRVGVSQIALAAMPRTVKIYYTPTVAGFHQADLVFNSEGAEEVRIPLEALGQDENAKPQLTILPETLEPFAVSRPGETQVKQLRLTAINMKGYVQAKVEGTDEGAFLLSTTMFPRNFEDKPLDITYCPRRAGEHNMTLVIYSELDRVERRIPLKGVCDEEVATEWIETFERVATDLTYGDRYVRGDKGDWHMVKAIGANDETRDIFNGTRGIRLGETGAELAMDFDLMTGIDQVTLMVAACKGSTETVKWRLEVSSDFGLTWTAVGAEQTIGEAGVSQSVTIDVKRAGVQRLRIVKTGGTEATGAMNVDDILITPMTDAPAMTWEELAGLDETSPLDFLNESFDKTRHNKPLALEGWRNFIVKGERPWWTYQAKEVETGDILNYTAKVTPYNSLVDAAEPHEMWLVTPALNGRTAGSKLFTFRVMGDLMVAEQEGGLDCYFIERFADTMARSRIDLTMPSIPDENGSWYEYHLDMALVEDLPEVFFIGFRYAGPGGRSNSATYYIDDVSYGRTDVPRITASAVALSFEAMANKIAESDVITVTGLNLTEEIRVSVGGDHPSSFTPNIDVLPAKGGSLRVGFIGSQEGIYSALLRLSSKGAADLYIPMEVRVSASEPTIVVAEKDKTVKLNVKSPAVSATSAPIIANPFFLTEAISLSVEGDDAALFTLSRASIPANGLNESFTVTFTPTAQNPSGNCRVRLKSAGAADVLITVLGTSNLANEELEGFKANVWRSNGGVFNVQAAGMREINVYTMSGRKVYGDRTVGDFKTVDLSKESAGIYILEIRAGKAVKRIRIVR